MLILILIYNGKLSLWYKTIDEDIIYKNNVVKIIYKNFQMKLQNEFISINIKKSLIITL
jgi:hypothetical protein